MTGTESPTMDHSIMEAQPIRPRIRAVRQRAGMSLDAFAKSIAYSRRALINWEQNVSDPTIGVLAKLRQLYDVDPEWVVLGQDLQPRSYYGAIDWTRLDQLHDDVDAACAEAGIDLEPGVRTQIARDLFEALEEEDDANRRRLRRTFAAIGKGQQS